VIPKKRVAKAPSAKRITQRSERAARTLIPVPHAGLNFGSKHHVFIAKLKRGELWALNHLDPAQKGMITPLFEMWPPAIPRKLKDVPGKPPKAAPIQKSLQKHSEDLMTGVRDDWGALPFFLDTRYVPTGGIPSHTSAAVIFQAARAAGLNAIPVTSLRFSPAYQAQIATIAAQDGRGIMVRLHLQDFAEPALLAEYLNAIQRVVGLKRNQIDILIDLEHRAERVLVAQLGNINLGILPFIDDWRTVTLAAGCFPPSITTWSTGQWLSVERSEWLGWNDIRTMRSIGGFRLASHGDYGVRCGGEPRFVPNTPAPNLRYTAPNTVLVRKGLKKDGHMKSICASLIKRSEFSGVGFSEGDRQISLKAAMPGSSNNGQAEQWIQWCTNHHLALTVSQIQILPGT